MSICTVRPIVPRDPYSFFLKVVSRASIPKNMLALAKFWLPFQKWRIIGKKRRQNGYMLKNLCFSSVSLFNEQIILKAGVFSGSDLAATIVIAFKWFEDVSWILMDSRRSDVQPASTKTFFWANDRSNWEADWQISQKSHITFSRSSLRCGRR